MVKSTNQTEFQKFDALVKKVLAVPHSEIKARMDEWKKQRKRSKAATARREGANLK